MLALRSVAQTRQDVLVREIGEVSQNFVLCHASREIGEHIVHGDPRATDAWATATPTGLNGDDSLVRHLSILAARQQLNGVHIEMIVNRRHYKIVMQSLRNQHPIEWVVVIHRKVEQA